MHATNVPSSLQPTATGVGVHRRHRTPGGAGASRLPQAPEHRGRSAEKCAPSLRGPAAELRTTWPWGLQPLQSPGTPMQTYLVALGTQCLHPTLGNGAPVCVREHVSPSQICYRFRARPILERPLNFSLTSLYLLHWKERRDLRAPGLRPRPLHCAGLGLGALAGLLKSK